MSWEAWFTLATVVATIAVLVRDLLPPSAAFVGAMVAVLAVDIIEPAEAFAGFSNPAPVTIAAMYVLAKAVEKTGALTPVVAATLGDGGSARSSLARMLVPTAAASAFMNNTPIVAMLVPQIERWSIQRGLSPSKFLMPLSFVAILGGVVTVIGTAINLVVSGLFDEAGLEPMGFFEISKVGLPIAIVGLALVVALAPLVLPDRRSAREEIEEGLRQFVMDMVVVGGGALDGKTVGEGGLGHLAHVFLVQVDRGGDLIAPVAPDTTLRGGDVLRFVGKSQQVVELQGIRGLVAAELDAAAAPLPSGGAGYFEAVVGAASPLVGRTLKEAGFRGTYLGAVVAIHRAGQLIDAKLGSVRLRVGDTLLVLADRGFKTRWSDRDHFLLIAPLDALPPASTAGAVSVAGVIAGIVALAATGTMPLVSAVLLGAVAVVALRVLTPREARDAVNLDVVVMIAAAFAVARAMATSGLAETIADGIVDVFGELGSTGVLLGVVLATVLLNEFIANTAAALLVFPIALSSATALGLDPRSFGMAVALAAAAAFLTPIGYQTNIMVYGPGGYRFTDYLRLGAPLTIAAISLIVLLVPVFWPY